MHGSRNGVWADSRTTDKVTSTLPKDLAMDLRREENEMEASKITPRFLA